MNFVLNTSNYMEEYHKRSNSESAFSADKKMLGWNVSQKRNDRINCALSSIGVWHNLFQIGRSQNIVPHSLVQLCFNNRSHILNVAVSPVVKWAGGKRQLLPQLTKLLPQKFNVYYEPFVGGAALLTYLYNKNLITKAIASDTNEDLINLYETIKRDPVLLAYELGKLDLSNFSDIYYSAREEFNRTPLFTPRKAALFIYLNRFGFNGIWRVNFKGRYNVPFGRHTNPHIPIEKISEFSKMLKRVTLLNKSFEYATVNAKKGDFVYFDPPYQPISKTSCFTDYTSQGFTIEHQAKLAENFKILDKKGVKIMLSNSAVTEIKDLYNGFYLKNVPANRTINSDSSKRTGFKEVVITNYKVSQSELETMDP